MNGLTLWMMDAYLGGGAHNAKKDIEALKLDLAGALRIVELLSDPAALFSSSELDAFARKFFKLNIDLPVTPQDEKKSYGVVAFPMLNGLSLSSTGYTPVNPEVLLLDQQYLQKVFTLRGQAGEIGAVTQASPPTYRDQLLLDYCTLILKLVADFVVASLHTKINAKEIKATDRVAISDLLPDAATIGKSAGMAGRFLFHGLRRPNKKHTHAEPVFALSNQTFNAAGSADAASLTLAAGSTQWKVSLQGKASMTIDAGSAFASPPSLLWPPSDVAKVSFEFQPQGVTTPALPMSEVAPTRFALNEGLPWGSKQLFNLPKPLVELTVVDGLVVNVALIEDPACVKDTSLTALPAADVSWYATVEFKVKKVDGAITPTYAFVSADAAGMSRLVPFLKDHPEPASNVSIGYKDGKAFSTGSDAVSFSLIQTNLSTESLPQQQSLLAAVAAATNPADLEFLAGFWAGAVTSFDGYFLTYQDSGAGLPDGLFDDSGEASLTLMLQIGTTGDVPTPYANYVAVPAQSKPLAAVVPSVLSAAATLPPGTVGIRVLRDYPPEPLAQSGASIDYGQNLDNLYSLLTCRIEYVGTHLVSAPLESAGIAPIDVKSIPDKMVFHHVFTPQQKAITGNLKGMANPYWAVGLDVKFDAAWTDVFGNLAQSPGLVVPGVKILYTDPVPKLSAMPNLAFCYLASSTEPTINIEFLFKTSALNSLVRKAVTDFDRVSGLVPQTAWSEAKTLAEKLLVLQAAMQEKPNTVLTDVYKSLSSIQQKVVSERDQYGLLAYQLYPYADTKSQVTTLLYSSMLNDNQGHPFNDGGVLLNLAEDIYQYYQELLVSLGRGAFLYDMTTKEYVANGLSKQLPVMQIKDVFDSKSVNLNYMYPADIEIGLHRVGNIHPDFADTPAVIESRSVVQPKPDQWNDENSGTTMPLFTFIQFAEAFAGGFSQWDMQIASGVVWDNGRPANGKQLWVLRWGESGIQPTFDPKSLASFAITPMSTKLISTSVGKVQIYDATCGGLVPADAPTTATNLDLDLELKQFLSAVDTFLQPELVVPAMQHNKAAVQGILAKKKIAKQLASYVQLTLTDATNEQKVSTLLEAAQERVKQSCLATLGSFYQIDALVALSLDTSLGGQAKLPQSNLFGNVKLSPAKSTTKKELENLQLCSGTAALSPNGSAMAFSVKSAQARAETDYWAKLDFEIGAIEHDVINIETGGTSHDARPWLRFVVPPANRLPQGTADIRIPLRLYPTAPSLKAQNFSQSDATDASPIENAKRWDYLVSYSKQFAAQDTVYAQLTFNPETVVFLAATPMTLVEALIQFDRSYTAIMRDIQTLASDTPVSYVEKTLNSYMTLIADVADAVWPVTGAELSLSPSKVIGEVLEVGIHEGSTPPNNAAASLVADDAQSYIWVTRESATTLPEDFSLPLVTIPGGYKSVVSGTPTPDLVVYKLENENGDPVSVTDVMSLPDRLINTESLNIISHQTAVAELRVGRNENFPRSFVYETAFISFPENLAPSLNQPHPIPIGSFIDNAAPDATSTLLEKHLSGLMIAMFRTAGSYSEQGGALKIAAFYEYSPTGQAASELKVSVPIGMALPISLTFNPTNQKNQDFISALATAIQSWLDTNKILDKAGLNSSLRLDLSLFSDLSKSGEPILHFQRLELPLSVLVDQS